MKSKICKISLFSAILACVANMPAGAVVKTKNSNRSYANAYNQVVAQQQQRAYYDATAIEVTTNSQTANLPVAVDDANLAEAIINNTSTSVNMSDLELCSMIYPNGQFKWSVPESGVRMNQTPQCVAVVELRDANTNAVLAVTTVAAGDSMRCNADMFPQSGLMPAITKVEVPNDVPPTMQDVEQVMNEEQKQNAGLKIAAAAIISGVAGNMLAPKNAGDTKLMGTSKTQLMDTALGMTAGAGIMAASTYSGKVAGDTIKSTAVNATAGMLVGNMAAGMGGGGSVLNIKKCKIDGSNDEKDCIVGNLVTKGDPIVYSEDESKVYLINTSNNTLVCERNTNASTIDTDGVFKKCQTTSKPLNIILKRDDGTEVKYDEMMTKKEADRFNLSTYVPVNESTSNLKSGRPGEPGGYYIIYKADRIASFVPAYAVYESDIKKPAFGYTLNDFKKPELQNFVAYGRNSNGSTGRVLYTNNASTVATTDSNKADTTNSDKPGTTASEKTTTTDADKYEFQPIAKDASDGGLIDINNEARAKATLIGTATGGALGGFAGYQGAKTELEQRWVEAVRTYNDSLSNFVCMTGGRFLAKYNDYVEIPNLKKPQQ